MYCLLDVLGCYIISILLLANDISKHKTETWILNITWREIMNTFWCQNINNFYNDTAFNISVSCCITNIIFSSCFSSYSNSYSIVSIHISELQCHTCWQFYILRDPDLYFTLYILLTFPCMSISTSQPFDDDHNDGATKNYRGNHAAWMDDEVTILVNK